MKKIHFIFNIMVILVSVLSFLVSATQTYGATEVKEQEKNSVDVQYIYDDGALLTDQEWQELESQARTVSKRHQCGIYFAIVNDYMEYGDGDVFDVAGQIYKNMKFGIGTGQDGIFVLLSMKEQDYAIFVYGENAEYAFNTYGCEQLELTFLQDFGNSAWYQGISRYLDACDEYLNRAEDGKPLRRSYGKVIIIVTGISCLCAGLICYLLMRNMKTVYQKAEADEYITAGGLQLTRQYDRYTHTTERRFKIEKESSGGSSSSSGGGGSGRSGKF